MIPLQLRTKYVAKAPMLAGIVERPSALSTSPAMNASAVLGLAS
jgi:hypothetical protein